MMDVEINQTMLDQFRMLERAGRPGVLAQMVGMFVRGSSDQIAALLAASESGDAEKLRVTAHTLKSNAGSFGATALAELCRDIEYDARAGIGRMDDARRERLVALHQATCAALNREIA